MARPDGRASARKSFVFLVVGIMIFFLSAVSSADVPHMSNYQGKLTTVTGGCLNDTVQMTFSIYPDTLGSPADWTETQTEVVVKEGIFNVLLGAVDTIPSVVFDGSIKYLGVQVESDPEMRPLKPIVSVAYAYRAGAVDGGGVNCEDCDDRFVNVEGPDSVVATTDPAFLGKAIGNGFLTGIKGYANSASSSAIGVYGEGYGSDIVSTYGVRGYAQNTSGAALGGYFVADSSGTGYRFGVQSYALGSSSGRTYGCYGFARNTSTGNVYGGYFKADSAGTGIHYGVNAEAFGSSSSNTYGYRGVATNSSTGSVYGCNILARNTSTGHATAGRFEADPQGTGTHTAVRGFAYGSSSPSYGLNGFALNTLSDAYAVKGYAVNASSGNAYGGHFYVEVSGSGTKYGVYASAPGGGNYAGYFDGNVRITDSLVVLGAKSAGVKVDNGEYRLLYSQESPEVWFEDFGEGQLVNGRTHIDLDPLFLETVTLNSQHPMKVFIQLTSGEPMNVVVHKGITGFDIVSEDISSNATFDYRVVAKRKGYENIRLAKMGGPTPEEVAAEQERHLAEQKVERARMEQERMEMDKERELR